MDPTPDCPASPGWYVISLRPRGGHAPVRRAAARHGARVLALSPWAIETLDTPRSREDLEAALSAPFVVFTSPAGVRAAAALAPLRVAPGQQWFAVGSGTAMALRRAGAHPVSAPERMDSEGLLALPGLQRLTGQRVGLVTAPGGRGTLVPAFEARGAWVVRADVYRRAPVPLAPASVAKLRALRAPAVLAVSSGEALQRVLETAGDDLLAVLRRLPVVAASDRLVELARRSGFDRVQRAASARPMALVEAAAALSPVGAPPPDTLGAPRRHRHHQETAE